MGRSRSGVDDALCGRRVACSCKNSAYHFTLIPATGGGAVSLRLHQGSVSTVAVPEVGACPVALLPASQC